MNIFVVMTTFLKPATRLLLFAATFSISALAIAQKKPVSKTPVKKTTQVKPVSTDDKFAEGPFMLKGIANNFPESTLVIISSKSDVNFRGPSAYVKNGQFLLSGKLPGPAIYNVLLTNPKNQQQSRYLDMFLDNEPSAIRFTGNDGDFEVLEGKSLIAFQGLVQDFGNDFDTLSRIQQNRNTPGINVDSLNNKWISIIERVKSKVPAFVSQYRQSAVVPFLLCTVWPVVQDDVDQVDGWLQTIDSAALANDFGYAIKEYVATEKVFGYGRVAPDFVQNDPQGQPVDLKSFRGKYVLVDFWASWCGPCRQENPNLVSAFNRYKDKNFTVLSISLDRDRNKWLQAIQDDQLSWTHVSDLGFWNNAVAKLYHIQSIPQNFVLDPEGRIIGKNLRGGALENFLSQVLK